MLCAIRVVGVVTTVVRRRTVLIRCVLLLMLQLLVLGRRNPTGVCRRRTCRLSLTRVSLLLSCRCMCVSAAVILIPIPLSTRLKRWKVLTPNLRPGRPRVQLWRRTFRCTQLTPVRRLPYRVLSIESTTRCLSTCTILALTRVLPLWKRWLVVLSMRL